MKYSSSLFFPPPIIKDIEHILSHGSSKSRQCVGFGPQDVVC